MTLSDHFITLSSALVTYVGRVLGCNSDVFLKLGPAPDTGDRLKGKRSQYGRREMMCRWCDRHADSRYRDDDGSYILTALSNLNEVGSIHAFTRKPLTAHAKVEAITSTDSATWPTKFPTGSPLYISALGTTRANAGGFNNQRKIDYDLNLELAKAAKGAGVKTYVLISSAGADSHSMMGYAKMKGELEEAVEALDFDHTVIVRPGLIIGNRQELRTAELVLQKIARAAGSVSGNRLKDFWAQDADVIAKAAVRAGLDSLEGREPGKVRLVTQADVIKLGRTEWKA
nr:protein fmp52, mitochondrial [Quercus suber]